MYHFAWLQDIGESYTDSCRGKFAFTKHVFQENNWLLLINPWKCLQYLAFPPFVITCIVFFFKFIFGETEISSFFVHSSSRRLGGLLEQPYIWYLHRNAYSLDWVLSSDLKDWSGFDEFGYSEPSVTAIKRDFWTRSHNYEKWLLASSGLPIRMKQLAFHWRDFQ